jgi:hypothetical protein
MEQTSEFDGRESLTVPANHLLAIIMEPEEASRTVQALSQSGFSRGEIAVLTGLEEAADLEQATGEKGFLTKLLTSGIDGGDEATPYIKQYRRAAMNGRTVIAVEARTNEARDKAREILKAVGGARFITFLGRFTIEILET